ncbi:hypothetical protein U1Q18_027882, partial [Sarracenia purpurea var. burkii]
KAYRILNKWTLIAEESIHVIFVESNHISTKEFSEEELQDIERGYQDIFFKETWKKFQLNINLQLIRLKGLSQQKILHIQRN